MVVEAIKKLFGIKKRKLGEGFGYFPIFVVDSLDLNSKPEFNMSPRFYVDSENMMMYFSPAMLPPETLNSFIKDYQIGNVKESLVPHTKLKETWLVMDYITALNLKERKASMYVKQFSDIDNLFQRYGVELNFFVQYQIELFWFCKVRKENVVRITEGDLVGRIEITVPFENFRFEKIGRQL